MPKSRAVRSGTRRWVPRNGPVLRNVPHKFELSGTVPGRGGLRRHLLISDVEVAQDAGCSLLDVLARRRDPGDCLFAIDTKGAHLLSEAAARKLLWIEPPRKGADRLFVKLVSQGKWKTDATQETKDGYTLWGIKAGSGRTVKHFDDLDRLIDAVLTARRG